MIPPLLCTAPGLQWGCLTLERVWVTSEVVLWNCYKKMKTKKQVKAICANKCVNCLQKLAILSSFHCLCYWSDPCIMSGLNLSLSREMCRNVKGIQSILSDPWKNIIGRIMVTISTEGIASQEISKLQQYKYRLDPRKKLLIVRAVRCRECFQSRIWNLYHYRF